jgi:hypothetical protein
MALALVSIMVAPMTISASLPLLFPLTGTFHSDVRPEVSTQGYWSWNDYPYAVPMEEPYKLVVADDVVFANFKGPVTVSFVTPSGEFSRIIMRVDIWMTSAVPGRPPVNYDRAIWIWIDGVPAYVGTTVQRFNQTGFADVTHLYSLLVGGRKANLTIALPNWVIPKWGLTGIFHVRVTLLYYPGIKPSVPDKVIPLFNHAWGTLAKVVLNKKRTVVTQEISVPANTVKAYLIVYTEGSSSDEFWYYNTPPDRFFVFSVDNKTVAFLQPYPYIFTGGINPLLWRPISSIRTYSFEPHVIDITPFLPLLIGTHNISLQIINPQNYWHVFAALLLYEDPNAYAVTGKILSYNFTGPLRSFKSYSTERGDVFSINSSMELNVTSEITVHTLLGEYTYTIKGHMYNFLTSTQSYSDVWGNVSMSQKWIYSTEVVKVEPSWASSKISYSWSDVWSSFLDVRDEFYISSEESPEHATPQHPVTGNFSARDWIKESLNISREPWPFTSSPRELKVSESAFALINGTIMFISPNAAIITGITATAGNTSKHLIGFESAQGFCYKVDRLTVGGNSWPKWWISKDSLTLTIKRTSSG